MTTPGKLHVQPDGRIAGLATIAYNDPFPCVNGRFGSGAMNGVVMHTMVGNLPGTIAEFNNPNAQASAHFGIAQDGKIWQFGPIGKGWIAWAQAAGNTAWYSIEHADNGNPDNPLTDAQVTASAQLVECLSAFAGFPLAEANTPSERGYGVHSMGGSAWGGHTCPDKPPNHVRSRQRPAILALAKAIRSGSHPSDPPPHGKHAADGKLSLEGLAHWCGTTPERLLLLTARRQASWGALQRPYVHAGAWSAPMPAGMIVWCP